MKVPCSLLILPLLVGNAAPLRAIDFTLHRRLAVADAVAVERAFVLDKESKIYLHLPAKWIVADSPQALNFTPDRVQSCVRLEQVSEAKSLPLDEVNRAFLRRRMSCAPLPGATRITTLWEKRDTLAILDWRSFEITQSYEFNGQAFRRCALYLDLGHERVVQLSVYAAEKDFDEIHAETVRLMSSWFEPSKDLPPDLARAYEN